MNEQVDAAKPTQSIPVFPERRPGKPTNISEEQWPERQKSSRVWCPENQAGGVDSLYPICRASELRMRNDHQISPLGSDCSSVKQGNEAKASLEASQEEKGRGRKKRDEN